MLIATYNVLANAYLHPDRYRGVPSEVLERRRRRAALLARIGGLGPEVICLQEVEEDCAHDLKAALASQGYAGVWYSKRGKPDGVATFVRSGAIVSDRAHYFEDPTGHLALMTNLRFEKRIMLVVNTHLKWDDPAASPEERWCVKQAESIVRALTDTGGDVVVCGDLNVTSSDVTVGRLLDAGFRDPFAGTDEPHTCFSNGRTQKVDHILVRGRIHAVPRRAPTARDMGPLPNEREPSDHIPLLADFD